MAQRQIEISWKTNDSSIIHPREKAKNRIELKGLNLKRLPPNIIITFFKDFYNVVEKYHPEIYNYHDDFKIYIFSYNNKRIALLYPLMGSYASMILEEIISLGGKKIIFLGGVGTTLKDINRGDIILPNRAIRDEGVSHHYESPALFSYPDKELYNKLKKVLDKEGIKYFEGTTWTIASFYRETEEKLNKFSKFKTVCVELEAASFFSIAKFRRIKIAGLFIAGDTISQKKWSEKKTKKNMPHIKLDREKLLNMALKSF